NASIHAFGQQNREFEGTGTTSTALLLRPEGAWISHVGDSRVYRIRAGQIEQLSYDHSLVWEYARIKQIDPDKVQDIPSNVIHRLGGVPGVNGQVPDPEPPQKRSWPRVPWWGPTLLLGTVLSGGAGALQYNALPGGLAAFILGAGAIVAGLVGLFVDYQQEQR